MTVLDSIPQVEQLAKLSSSQSDKYAAPERLGAAKKKRLATWRQQESVSATSS